MTNFTAGSAGSPRWSPDSRTIVFDARPEGLSDIYSISADGGAPQRLTDNPAEDHLPCYSIDGRWIYFASTRSGPGQIYRMPAEGGEATQITHKDGYMPVTSPDGKWIYYSKAGFAVWKVGVNGGDETGVLPPRSLANLFAFDVTPTGIYYAGPPDLSSTLYPLKLYRFADGKTVELAHFDKPLQLHIHISPDEKWVYYTQLDSAVDDLMLVENFK